MKTVSSKQLKINAALRNIAHEANALVELANEDGTIGDCDTSAVICEVFAWSLDEVAAEIHALLDKENS